MTTKNPAASSQKQQQQVSEAAVMNTKKPPASSKKEQLVSEEATKTTKTICSQIAADDRSPKQQQQPAIGSQEPAAASSLKKQCPPKGSQKVPEARPPKKQTEAKSSQNAAATASSQNKQPNKGVANSWTMPNPKFKSGHTMLTAAELESVGPATAALHAYYMKGCRPKQIKTGIVVKYQRNHLLRSLDSECFPVGFSDLYDLFKIDALDVSLLCCFTLSMIVEAKASLPVGFLDPEVLTVSTMSSNKSYVLNYLTKAFKHFAKKDCIMFAHNTNGHWMLVVVVPRWSKVLYFDSMRSQSRDHTLLKEVINESYLAYCRYKGLAEKVLVHATKFPCHQQPAGNTCGFYTAGHMMEALRILEVDDPQDFEVSTSRIADDVLSSIREKISPFLVHQVIESKGELHCPTPGINMLGHSQ